MRMIHKMPSWIFECGKNELVAEYSAFILHVPWAKKEYCTRVPRKNMESHSITNY